MKYMDEMMQGMAAQQQMGEEGQMQMMVTMMVQQAR